MRKLTATLCLMIALLLGSAGCDESADLQQGYAAYESGDYVNALHVFRSLSEKGNADAQTMLGWMYANGKGVSQNKKTALKWYKLVAEKGNAYADI